MIDLPKKQWVLLLFALATSLSPAQAASSVTLAWDAVTNVAGYRLYQGVASRIYTSSYDVGRNPTCIVSNLLLSVTNFFAVTAYDTNRLESDFSNEIQYQATNQLPSISALPNQTTTIAALPVAVPFTVGDIETQAANLSLAGTSSNPGLVPDSSIVFAGTGSLRTLTVTPLPNRFGSATITVTLTDGNGGSVSSNFVFTASAPGGPTLDPIGDLTIPEDAGTQTVTLTGLGSGTLSLVNSSVLLAAFSSNPSLIPDPGIHYTSPQTSSTLSLIPAPGVYGNAIITVLVLGGSLPPTLVRSFRVTVTPVNHNPVISGFPDQVFTDEDVPKTLSFTVGDVETPAANLVLFAESSNEELISSQGIVFGGGGSNRTVTLRPLANEFGSGFIFIIVTDADGGSASTLFELDVNPVNDPPTILGLPGQVTSGGDPINVPFALDDVETPASDLIVSVVSSSQVLIPNGNLVLGGSGAQRTLTITPVPNVFGTAFVTLQVSDGGASNNLAIQTFSTIVVPRTLLARPDLQIMASTGQVTLVWPQSAVGFQLEATVALSPANWSPVSATTLPVLDQNTVTLTNRGSDHGHFFRLRKP